MIVYNVTVKIDNDAHDEWLHWMRTKHIPDVIKTECFVSHRIHRVLVDDQDGHTYAIQYDAESMDDLERYQTEFATELQKEHTERYKDRFVAFRTLLESVD